MYQWRNGSVHRVDAEIAGPALEKMAEQYGRLTAGIVVNESRPEDAPLHAEFDWIDAEAAEKWREHQARNVINSIRVVTESEPAKVTPIYVHVTTPEQKDAEPEPRYVRVSDALADQALRREVLTRAIREMDAWERRYRELEELALVFESAKIVRQQLAGVA